MKVETLALAALFLLPASARGQEQVVFSSSSAKVTGLAATAGRAPMLELPFDQAPPLPAIEAAPADVEQDLEAAIGLPSVIEPALPSDEELARLAAPAPVDELRPAGLFAGTVRVSTRDGARARLSVLDESGRRLAGARSGVGELAFAPKEPGFYFARAESDDGSSEAPFTVPATARFEGGEAAFLFLPDKVEVPALEHEVLLAALAYARPPVSRVEFSVPRGLPPAAQAAVAKVAAGVARSLAATVSPVGAPTGKRYAEVRLR